MLTRVAVVCVLVAFGLACRIAPDERPRDPVAVAHVGERRITEAELDAAWRERQPTEYARVRQSIYEMRRAVLNDLIADALVEDEVARVNRPERELIALAMETGVLGDVPPIDEGQIEALYEQSGAMDYGIRLDTLRQEFVEVLKERRVTTIRERYRDHLRTTRNTKILLNAPRTFIPVTPTDPIRGALDARVKIIEFSDFHCQFCRRTRPVLEKLLEKYAGEVQWIWKDYPLGSAATAVAAACAHDQDAFWEYHDALFDRQHEIAPDDEEVLQNLAHELGLNGTDFARCVTDQRLHDRVASNVAAGVAAGVTGTPTVFVNGRMIAGAQSFDGFERVVLEELELITQEEAR